MNILFRRTAVVAALTVALGGLGISPAHAATQFTFAVDAPNVQGTFVSGAIVETFDDGCISPIAVGTVTGSCDQREGNYYAGASSTSSNPVTGGTASPYGNVQMGSVMTIDLESDAYYLGFHWEAGNEFDRVQLFNNGELAADFSFDTLMTALDGVSFSTEGGDTYATSDYFGNPVSGVQDHEPYAFIHVFAEGGAVFDRIVISEDADSPGQFEFDNLAVSFVQQEVANDVYTIDVVEVDGAEEPTVEPEEELAATGVSVSDWAAGAVVLAAFVVALMAVRRRRAS